jgi:hypothetical protein
MAKPRQKSLDQIIADGPSQVELESDQMDADSDPSHQTSPVLLTRLKKQIDALSKQYEQLAKPPKTRKITTTPRNHKTEAHLAKTRRAGSLAAVRAERDANSGDEEIFQVAQALILCGLPYEKTDQIRITRTARIADGSIVSVTFTVVSKDGEMPYGSDRSLLHFLFNKAVKSNNRFVSWETATEFLKAMNISDGGKNYRDLRARFDRIRGLVISVERQTSASRLTETTPIIRRSHLPTSVDIHAAKKGQPLLPIDATSIVFGVELDENFF